MSMKHHNMVVLMGASLLWIVAVRAATKESHHQGRIVTKRMTAEMPGWEDNDYRVEPSEEHMWGWGGLLHHPGYDHDPWAPKDPHPWYEEPKDPHPWYGEPNPWEEPCIPQDSKDHSSSYSEDHHSYHSRDLSENAWEEEGWIAKAWAKEAEEEEEWWDEYDKEHEKKTKTLKSTKAPKAAKGAKGKKGNKGGGEVLYDKPKHKPHYKPKPCPTKEPAKEPTKVPTVVSGSHDEPTITTRPDEIIVVLTPFTILYNVLHVRHPNEYDIKEIEATTMAFLQDYFFEVFASESGAIINFFDNHSPKDNYPRVHNDMIAVHFRAKAFFDGDSEAIPTTDELDTLLQHAFWGESLDEYHEELETLPEKSVFDSATVYSVSTVASSHEHNQGVHHPTKWKGSNKGDALPHEDLPQPKNVATSDNDSEEPSSFSPPVMVLTVVSSTTLVMGAILFGLYKQKAAKKQIQLQQQNLFPPPKDEGHSIAEATMMEEEDSMVECEIGDDDFSVGSKSTRRSRAENFLRLMEDDEKSTGPRRFLVANASRRGNTWNQ